MTATPETDMATKAAPRKRVGRNLEAVTPNGAVGERHALKARIEELETELQAKQAEVARQERRWDRTWDRLGQEADDRDWCDEYDRIARELGGTPRRRNHNVTIKATLECPMDVDAVRRAANIYRYTTIELPDAPPPVRWMQELLATVRSHGCACTEVTDVVATAAAALLNSGVQATVVEAVVVHCDDEDCTRS